MTKRGTIGVACRGCAAVLIAGVGHGCGSVPDAVVTSALTEDAGHRLMTTPTEQRAVADDASEFVRSDLAVHGAAVAKSLVFGVPARVRSGSRYSVEIPVANRADLPVAFEYRFVFLDASNQPLPPDLAWKPGQLGSFDMALLRAATRHRGAAHYRLEVRARAEEHAAPRWLWSASSTQTE